MISAHSLAARLRHPHLPTRRRSSLPGQEACPHLPDKAPGAFFVHEEDSVERVVILPEQPRIVWPMSPPEGYRGQLGDEFQKRMAAERAFIERRDCDFYHTSVLSNGEVIDGVWDMRGREDVYLGLTPMSGKRVLEFGPASGYLSFYMERMGAEVVGFDVGWDLVPNLMEPKLIDMTEPTDSIRKTIGTVQNAWWYLHRDYGSKVKMAYGNIYDLPSDMGVYDVSVFGAILLHLRDPWTALAQAAKSTRERIVVTDLNSPSINAESRDIMANAVRYAPCGQNKHTLWWAISPGAIVEALHQLGFSRTRVILHSQYHHVDHDLSQELTETPMFTVVADREWAF